MTREWRKEILPVAALIALCGALFGTSLGTMGLMDPDEPFYSLAAKEMIELRDPSTPMIFGKPQFEKPIFFYWVLYAFFSIFGVNETAARLGSCLAGVLTVLLTYALGRVLFRRRAPAFLSALVLAASVEFIILSRIVLTDMFLCLFVTATFLCFAIGWRDESRRTFFWRAMFAASALAFLTKGPLGFLIPFAGILSFLYIAERRLVKQMPWVSGLLIFSMIALPWYALMEWKYPGFLGHFFLHENVRRFFVAEHSGSDKWFFYPMVFLLGFFPWTTFVIPGMMRAFGQGLKGQTSAQKVSLLLVLSFLLPFIFFTGAKSKLMSYFFPLYPIIALMTGSWLAMAVRAVHQGAFPRRRLSFFLGVMWGVAPLTIVSIVLGYTSTHSMTAWVPITVIAATFIPSALGAFFFYHRRRYAAAAALVVASLFCVFTVTFGWLLPQLGHVFSSKEWARDYKEIALREPSQLLLTSKLYVRGMTYYTNNKNIGVFSDKPNGGFYTAHPIRIVSSAAQIAALADTDFPVILLLRQKEMKHLRSLLDHRYTISILKDGSQRILGRLDRV